MYAIGRGMAWSSGGVAILEATGRALPMSAPHAGLRAPRCDRPPRPSERFARPVSIAFGHVAAAHPEAPPHLTSVSWEGYALPGQPGTREAPNVMKTFEQMSRRVVRRTTDEPRRAMGFALFLME